MSIQSNLNQLLNIGAIGAGIYMSSPSGEAITANREADKAKTLLNRQIATKYPGVSMENAKEKLTPEQLEELILSPEVSEAIQTLGATTKKAAQLSPSKRNVKREQMGRELTTKYDKLMAAKLERDKAQADIDRLGALEVKLAELEELGTTIQSLEEQRALTAQQEAVARRQNQQIAFEFRLGALKKRRGGQ